MTLRELTETILLGLIFSAPFWMQTLFDRFG